MRLIVGLINLLVVVIIVVLLGVAYTETTQSNEQNKNPAPAESEIIHSSLSGVVSDTIDQWSSDEGDEVAYLNTLGNNKNWVVTNEYPNIVAFTGSLYNLGTTYGYAKELYFQGETDGSWLKIDLDTWEITISKELDMDAASLMFIRGVQYYAEDRIEYLERILNQKGIPYE